MGTGRYQRLVEGLLSPAGITINGNNPWDIQIKDERFYRRVIKEGSLGLGESYMEGWWECERLDEFFYKSRHMHVWQIVFSKKGVPGGYRAVR